MKIKELISDVPLAIIGLFLLYLIDPFNLGYLFGYLSIFFVLFRKQELLGNLDMDVFLLLLFSLTYSVFYSFDLTLGTQYVVIYFLFPLGFYLLGKYFVKKIGHPKKIYYFLFGVGFVFSLTTLISVLIDIGSKGFVVVSRDVPVFWDNHIIPATNMAALLTLNMSIPALLTSNFKNSSFWFKIFAITIYILSVVCVLRLGSRTQLAISLLTLIATVLYLFTQQSAVKNVLMFLGLFVLVNIAFSYLSFDKNSDLLSAFASRMDSKEYGAATAGGRTERWQKSIENLFEEPLGWQVTEFGFSHNLWFDVARVGGVIAFLLLLIYSIRSIVQIRRAIGLNRSLVALNTIFLVYGLSFFLLFMVEPIFDGYFPVFVFFCFYKGVINKYYEQGKLRVQNTVTDY